MSSINSRVPPLRLMAVDTPTDGQLPSYQSSSGKFEWVDDSSGSPGGSDGDFQINNSGAFGGSILSTNKTTTVTLNSGASGDPQLQMTSNTKAITLTCDSNSKLKVEGALYSWELDASSATGGITFPDGTTQTTAASGGGAFAKLINPKDVTPTTYTDELFQQFFPYGCGSEQTFTATSSTWRTFYHYFPFYSNGDGKITDLRYKITAVHSGNGTEMAVVIYNTDDEGWPQTKIGTATLDLTTLGNDKSATITETSTDSMTLTKGELYWIGYKENGTTGFARIQALLTAATPALGIQDQGANNLQTYNGIISTTDPPPATWSNASDLTSTTQKQILMLGGPFT